ncbi:M56 family metallopeptidase [Puniceicoccaceae bacterium K14]|nr:M56 family metallopeptidase [Puniceicoccaceae bacterium K14]
MKQVIEILGLHLIESTIVGSIIILLLLLFRIKRPSFRSRLLRLVFLKFLFPVGLVLSFWDTGQFAEPSLIGVSLNSWVNQSAILVAEEKGVSIFVIGLFMWAVGFCILAIAYSVEWVRSEKLLGESLKGESLKRIRRVLRELEADRFCEFIRIEKTNATPILIIGIFRPRIVINNAFFNALTDNELRPVLRHELEHWNRKDNLWRAIQVFVLCLFWFHPLLWYAYFRSSLESECACDEAAMNGGEERKAYASCLLKATRFFSEPKLLWSSMLTGKPLKRRIEEIVNFKNEKDSKMKLLSIWTLVASLAVGSSLLAVDYQSSLSWSEQSENEVRNINELDTIPKAVYQVAPTYPDELLESKIEGHADVVFVIDQSGDVRDVDVIQSSAVEFEYPAVEAINVSKWEPGKIDGVAVNVRVRQRILFKLPE